MFDKLWIILAGSVLVAGLAALTALFILVCWLCGATEPPDDRDRG